MSFLILGGTAWLGREVVAAALARDPEVTVLARGESGPLPEGVSAVRADRSDATAYDEVADRDWDAVIDVARQPSHVRGAVAALSERAASWVFVSSASVYAAHDEPGADERAALLPAHDADDEAQETYGERKVACERIVLDGLGDRALVARSGLIAGPGDHTDRTGYWPLRFAHPATADGAVLAPDSTVSTQVIDVRDLAAWLVHAAEQRAGGVANAAGPVIPLPDHLAAARQVAGHRDEVVWVAPEWLEEQHVEAWAGERSLPLWLPVPEYAGFMARSTAVAQRLGLQCRPLEQTLADVLEWEVRQGPGRPRKAGLSPTDEAALIAKAREESASESVS
jgi:nucleoside-diphosphate-sugar epimerase